MGVVHRCQGLRLVGLGPQPQHVIEQHPLCVARGGLRQLLHLGRQGCSLRRAQAHGLAQVAHPPAATHFGQRRRRGVQRDWGGELAIEGVVDEVEVGGRRIESHTHCVHQRGAAVAARNRGRAADGVAVAQVDAAGRRGQRNACDALAGQRGQLVALADAVLVQVLPQFDVGELGVGSVEQLVAVGVETAQRLEAIGGIHRVDAWRAAEQGVYAEQLAAGVNAAVAIAVEHQPCIVGAYPTRTGFDAVGVVVEQDGGGGDAYGFDAVAVEIDRQRVARGGGTVISAAAVITVASWPHARD